MIYETKKIGFLEASKVYSHLKNVVSCSGFKKSIFFTYFLTFFTFIVTFILAYRFLKFVYITIYSFIPV